MSDESTRRNRRAARAIVAVVALVAMATLGVVYLNGVDRQASAPGAVSGAGDAPARA